MGYCCLLHERVQLTVNSKKETNGRVKMGQGSKWAKGQDGFLLFTPYPLKESKRAKMGCCCLPPDRVKLTVKSKKQTNSKVKMAQESNWAKGQDGPMLFTPWKSQNGLLLFTPWQSQTNSEQQVRNKQQGQNGPWVKMGFCYFLPERVKRGCCCLPLTESNWQWKARKKQTAGSKWAKSQNGLLLFTPWKSQNGLLLFTPWQSQTNSEKQERNKQQGQNGPRAKMGFCILSPERVKIIQVSIWAVVIYPLKESN